MKVRDKRLCGAVAQQVLAGGFQENLLFLQIPDTHRTAFRYHATQLAVDALKKGWEILLELEATPELEEHSRKRIGRQL